MNQSKQHIFESLNAPRAIVDGSCSPDFGARYDVFTIYSRNNIRAVVVSGRNNSESLSGPRAVGVAGHFLGARGY